MDCALQASLYSQIVEGVGNGLFSLTIVVICLVFLDRRYKQKP